jgi:hypothetical protein
MILPDFSEQKVQETLFIIYVYVIGPDYNPQVATVNKKGGDSQRWFRCEVGCVFRFSTCICIFHTGLFQFQQYDRQNQMNSNGINNSTKRLQNGFLSG